MHNMQAQTVCTRTHTWTQQADEYMTACTIIRLLRMNTWLVCWVPVSKAWKVMPMMTITVIPKMTIKSCVMKIIGQINLQHVWKLNSHLDTHICTVRLNRSKTRHWAVWGKKSLTGVATIVYRQLTQSTIIAIINNRSLYLGHIEYYFLHRQGI